jgi:ribosomal protein L7/L12
MGFSRKKEYAIREPGAGLFYPCSQDVKGNPMDEQQIAMLQTRVSLLERQVKFLLEHQQVEYVDHAETQFPDVAELKRQGKVIDAIKLYRFKTNVGLAEAKMFVDGL